MLDTYSEKRYSEDSDWGYINARLRARKKKLLTVNDLKNLLKSASLEVLANNLLNTEYGREIKELENTKATTNYLELLEKAVKNNLVRSFQETSKMLGGEHANYYQALVTPIEIYNVKTLLRGLRKGDPPNKTYNLLIPIGTLSASKLKSLVEIKDTRELLSLIKLNGIDYIRGLDKYLDSYYYTNNLEDIENVLDHCKYRQMISIARRQHKINSNLMTDYIKLDIDMTNIKTLLKMTAGKVSQVDASKYYIAGGKSIKEWLFQDLVLLKDLKKIIAHLSTINLCKPLAKQLDKIQQTNNIGQIESVIQNNLFPFVTNYSKRDPLGLGVMISYLENKKSEVVNLRIIFRACEYGIPDEYVFGELILG